MVQAGDLLRSSSEKTDEDLLGEVFEIGFFRVKREKESFCTF
jgi:hypothetical protein